MGLFQQAVETYNCHQNLIGQYETGQTVLPPISHIVTRADLEITLNAEGEFLSAVAVDKKEPKIIIPATEESAGRTSGVCAHPLCDQLGYLATYNSEKHQAYLKQLEKWASSENSHPKLHPILAYIRGDTILSDLGNSGLVQLNDQGLLENESKDGKLLVRWRVEGLEDGFPAACWEDTSLFEAFIRFYRDVCSGEEQTLCMVSGQIGRRAKQHAKGVVPIHGNAKLISANDTSGFTYRGRFTSEEQASAIGYESSQKAHNALRWLVADQGVMFGNRTFVCWNPQGYSVCHAAGAFAKFSAPVIKPTEYKDQLKKTLEGYRSQLPETSGVVIAAFDAATSGRLALTYYNELMGSDFLQRLYDWDDICCWPNAHLGIQSPPLKEIVNYAFGTPKKEKNGKIKIEIDDKLKAQQMQFLLSCRIDRVPISTNIVQAFLRHASNLAVYKEDGPAPENKTEDFLATACAVIRKYHYDRYKEEWSMALDPNKADRSYQFGRLLAVLEKAERAAFRKDEKREPNAVRLQSVFCQRPLYAANNIEKQLERAYFPRLNPGSRMFYKELIGQIMEQISQFPEEQWNQPLRETYLMGYYLQRNDLLSRKNENMEEKDHE